MQASHTPSAASNDTTALWRHLFGEGRGYLCVFAGERAGKQLRRPLQTFFAYPEAVDTAIGWLDDRAAAGFDTYFCAHLLTDTRRKKDAAAPVRALWCDIDVGAIPTDPAPTAVVESSPGRFHAYWQVLEAIEPTRAEALNKRLAKLCGGDPSGADLTQLLRPPGYPNRKYDNVVARLMDWSEYHGVS
jgi:hypothetical protein